MVSSVSVKRSLIIAGIIGIFILTFLVIKDILISISVGLLFAYIFIPVYRKIFKITKRKNISVLIIMLALILVILVPIIYLTPVLVNQTFQTYVSIQNIDLAQVLQGFMSKDTAAKVAINIDNLIGKTFSSFLNQFTDLLVNLPSIILQFAVFLFTFYFALRDSEELKAYLSTLSPFSESTEKKFMSEFRGITNAIVFGQVLIGIIQGLALGVGLFFLGVPGALTLTVLACIVSIIPILGSWLIWLPVAFLLLVSGQTFAGIFLLLYGALFVSTIDNLMRPYLLSRKSNLPVSLSLIGTIGGLYLFGIMGLIFGPLIFAYALIIIEFYRKGKLDELFRK